MKPKTVGYSESHETINSMGLKTWVKNWYEVELDSGDSPDECHEHCKNKVQSWNTQSYFNENTTLSSVPLTGQQTAPPIRNTELERKINAATSVEELEKLYDEAEKYFVTALWDNKLKSLT